ncbi:hypothetical protein CR513_09187, partial [Mucuna pruriens]
MLPYTLHRYRTSMCTSTWATPYSLAYGTKAGSRMDPESVRPYSFKEGDLVPRKILPNAKDSRWKWAANYEEPYVLKSIFSKGAFMLTDLEGHELIHPTQAWSNILSPIVQSRKNPKAKGIRPEAGPDLYPIPWDPPGGTHAQGTLMHLCAETRKGNASAHLRIWQPYHHVVTKPMQSQV